MLFLCNIYFFQANYGIVSSETLSYLKGHHTRIGFFPAFIFGIFSLL